MTVIHHSVVETPLLPCVATIGFFDGVHVGHRFLINQVKEMAAQKGLCSTLITFPTHPRRVMNSAFQPELLSTPQEKEELLMHAGADYCVMLEFTPELASLSARQFMVQVLKQQLQVSVLVIGYDHRFGHNRSEGFTDYCRYGAEIGIEVIRAEACTVNELNISSSLIRSFLQEGALSLATQCLGYEYYLDGYVVDGYKVGRTIGFPTANLKVENLDKLIPADGVYAVRVGVAGKEYMGMLNIGNRPTLNNGKNKTIEVNILHFSSDIYDQFIRITFVRYLRPEIKYSCLKDLMTQLYKDQEEVEEVFFRLPTGKV